MSRIVPIPTTRVGDFFVRQRMVQQVQSDQLDLFRLQTQVSTGRRIILPSEDAPAALRAISLQRTLQRKGQVQTNLQGTTSVLSEADASLNSVSNLLTEVRAQAISVTDTISTAEQRQAVIDLVNRALADLVKSGNSSYVGRYLFSGSRTNAMPFDFNGDFVEYLGNEKDVRSFVDVGQLFETNIPGSAVFGGLSAEIRGTVDLNPHVTFDTLLSSINGGDGIGSNAAITVSVNNGGTTTSSIVDLSGAVTLGDVARLIEEHPPAGANIEVDINGSNGLTITSNVGSVRVSEVAAGRTAKELGIFNTTNTSPSLTGSDLDPAVLKTTRLSDLLGTKALGRVESTGSNNDLFLTSAANGAAYNGTNVEFVGGGVAGSEVVTYDQPSNTLTIQIQNSVSTANQVAAAINAAAVAGDSPFLAEADYRDASTLTQSGSGTLNIGTFTAVTNGGGGEALDTASGVVLTNGGKSVALDISGAETVEDLINLINSSDVGLLADINAANNGIDVRSVLSGADFTIGENGGTTATQLGIRTFTADTRLDALNRGVGVPTNDLQDDQLAPFVDDLQIIARDGTALTVDLTGATTLQDVVDLVNTDPNNNTGGTAVLAQLTPDGHGIELVDSSATITGSLTVLDSQAAEYLGFLSAGQPSIADNTADVSGNYSLASYRHSNEDDLVVIARDGTELWVDLTGATTIQDVIDRVNSHPRNNSGTTAVEARLATNGNGITLVDSSAGTGTLEVQAAELSQAAEYLGFIPNGTVTTDGSGNDVLQSEDRHTLEVDSVFNTLIRLRRGLEQNDVPEIGRAIDRLDADLNRVNFARAEVGSRLQSLDVIQARLKDENVQLQSALSDEIDVDLVEAISNLTARQYALQASLQTTANILNLSILDYI
jgi:flagellar hook-associated protein 3 FlgL